jgi:hypothetical protein
MINFLLPLSSIKDRRNQCGIGLQQRQKKKSVSKKSKKPDRRNYDSGYGKWNGRCYRSPYKAEYLPQ